MSFPRKKGGVGRDLASANLIVCAFTRRALLLSLGVTRIPFFPQFGKKRLSASLEQEATWVMLHIRVLFTGYKIPGSFVLDLLPHYVREGRIAYDSPNQLPLCTREPRWIA